CADDSPSHGQHIGVVVLSGLPGRIQIVAQRGPDALNFVGRHLLTLPAPTEHDAALGPAVGNGPGDGGADGRVVDGLLRVGAEVVDGVPVALEQLLEALLEAVARVVGADRDVHGRLPGAAARGQPTGRVARKWDGIVRSCSTASPWRPRTLAPCRAKRSS